MYGKALLVGLLVVLPALAGCADDAPKSETVKPGSTSSSGSPVAQPSPVSEFKPRGTSERWHFHDYWKGNPTIVLFDGNLSFNATTFGADSLPALSAIFYLPHGVIVPPETGVLTVNVTWPEALPGGLVNLTYKPADANSFFTAGEAGNGLPIVVNTTESNCDVPHRQESSWTFNLTAKPGGVPPNIPAKDVRIIITATIGRPLFIDPPHLNWWRDGEILPIVAAGGGDIRTARTPVGNITLPGGVPGVPQIPPQAPNPNNVQAAVRVPVDQGRIVPEGAKSIVAILNWTTLMPNAPKLTLRYWENNYPSEGTLDLLSETGTSRVYTLKVSNAQTDTTYSNRTTWEFRVLPEGEPAAAFEGSFTLVAWVAQLDASTAAARVVS